MLSMLTHNIRFAARQLASNPVFSLFAACSLAIGMAASITLFSAANTLLFAPVRGVGAPDDLVELASVTPKRSSDSFSAPDFTDLATRAGSFAELFAYRHQWLNVNVAGGPQRAFGLMVSGNYFHALQVGPYRGRLLGADDDRSGAAPVAVATYAGWRKYFNGDEAAIGKTVSINGQSFTLIGVAAPDFGGTVAMLKPAFYVALAQQPLLQPGAAQLLTQRGSTWLSLGARLAPGTTPSQAREQLSAMATQLAADYPRRGNEGGTTITVEPLRGVPGEIRGGLVAFSALLFVLIALLLLVACVNVASLLLARGEARRHEIAVRFVLGAGRARVMLQLMIESALLAFAAGGIGLALAEAACRLLSHVDPPVPVPLAIDISIDASALWFALGCTITTALAFGLMPALRVSSYAPAAGSTLADARTAGRRSKLGSALVVAQIALTMILLVGGGLFMRAMVRAAAIDPGFDVNGVLAADFNLEPSGYSEARQLALETAVLDRLQATPGVDAAAAAALVPLDFTRLNEGDFQVPGQSGDALSPFVNLVSPGYFRTLDIRLQGRDFDTRDIKGSAEVCVVNATLARTLAADGDVIGRSFAFADGDDRHTLTVVGIVPDGKYASLNEAAGPFMFLPLGQWPRAEMSLIVKTRLQAGALAGALHDAMRAVDPSLPPAQVRSLADILALSLLPQRIAALTALALGAIGLLLAAVGLYGLIAMYVAARTREFGVRISLGATPARILSDVVRRGAILAGAGLLIGTLLALGGDLVVSDLLYGATAGDALAFAGAALLLIAVALLASYLPARVAARTAPLVALRHD
ncbi:MAG TPA: ADOP family duplicated permease [Rhodanobacteraceae bacterium]|nr:ADOP family duplicated permease [Rhodanobacteraceae bacterium]